MTEKRDCYFFFSSVFSPALQSLPLTSKWVFTQVQWTQNSRDRKRWREQRAAKVETSRSWQLLYAKFFLWEMMWRFCVAVAAIIQYLQPSFPSRNIPGQSSHRSWDQECSVLNDRCEISHFPCGTNCLFVGFFSPNGGTGVEGVSAAALKVSVHTGSDTVRVMIRETARMSATAGLYKVNRFWWSPFWSNSEASDSAKKTPLSFCYKMLV